MTTLDIGDTFQPDVTGSVHNLSLFTNGSFDVVIVSHVLEHVAVAYLDAVLAEMARIARFSIVYLPVADRHAQVRLIPGFHGFDWSWSVDLCNVFHRPDGITPRYGEGQHFWEVGYREFRKRDLLERFSRFFERHIFLPKSGLAFESKLRFPVLVGARGGPSAGTPCRPVSAR